MVKECNAFFFFLFFFFNGITFPPFCGVCILLLRARQPQVCVVHLHSSAGTLPRQHVFLRSAVGAMATMNLTKNPSDPSLWPKTLDAAGVVEDAALREGIEERDLLLSLIHI